MKAIWALFALFLVTGGSARADGKFTCSAPEAPPFLETVVLTGSGTNASVHIGDSSLSADLTYNAQMTQAASGSLGVPAGALAFFGTMEILTSQPPTEVDAVFFLDASLVNGAAFGNLYRPSTEGSFTTFACR